MCSGATSEENGGHIMEQDSSAAVGGNESATSAQLHGIPVVYLATDDQARFATADLRIQSVPGVPQELADTLERDYAITHLFPFQKEVLAYIRSTALTHSGDVLLGAPTGSGKTLIYALAVLLDLYSSASLFCVRALVVLPTRELARQVEGIFRTLTASAKLSARVAVLSLLRERVPPSDLLNRQAVCITTPGRLVEALDRHELHLADLRWLVIDEADRLFRQSYQNWLERLLQRIDCARRVLDPPLRRLRKLLFSATQTRDATHLAALRLHHPVYLLCHASTEGARQPSKLRRGLKDQVPAGLTLCSLRFLSEEDKLRFLLRLIVCGPDILATLRDPSDQSSRPDHNRMLIFVKSVETTHRLCRFVQLASNWLWLRHYPSPVSTRDRGPRLLAEEISKQVSESARAATLERFQRGTTQWLICSDVMARGMDIAEASHVVNFDVPAHPTTYLHRVGRVARAGRPGTALTFLLRNQVGYFQSEIIARVRNDTQKDLGIIRAEHIVPDLRREPFGFGVEHILRGTALILELEQQALVAPHQPLSLVISAYVREQVVDEPVNEVTEMRAGKSVKRMKRALSIIALQNWCDKSETFA
jgi:ATP-dependent RNA helicase DDX51/DBP6